MPIPDLIENGGCYISGGNSQGIVGNFLDSQLTECDRKVDRGE